MRTTGWITLYAGLLIGAGYLIGSTLHLRLPRSHAVKANAIEAATVAIWAYLSYRLIDWVAPGTSQFREFSAVGILSPRALTIWEAVALWSGLAVVIGLIAPFDRGFRTGGNGLAAGAGLVLVFSPFPLFAAVFAWAGAQWLLRPRTAVLLALFALVASEWVLSMLSASVAPQAWGFVHGPETTLWLAGLGGALAARQSHAPPGDLPHAQFPNDQ